MFNRFLDRVAEITDRHPKKAAVLMLVSLTLTMLCVAATCSGA